MPSTFYKVSDNVDDMHASDVNQLIDALSGTNDVGIISLFAPLAAPAAPTATVNSTSGNLNGAYKYAVAFVTGYWKGAIGTGTMITQGNTGGGAQSLTVSPANQQVNLSAIPVGPVGTIARIIYRTKTGGSTFYFLQQINDNTTTSWTDNVADAALVTTMSISNTTGTSFSVGGTMTASRFISSVTAGTAPFTVSSKTKVVNLNVDQVDDYDFDQSVKTTDSPTFAGLNVGDVTLTAGKSLLWSDMSTKSTSLTHGLGMVNMPPVSSQANLTVSGRTLVNIIGPDGNFEKDSNADGVADGWTKSSQASYSIATTNVKYGAKAQRIDSLAGDTSAATRRVDHTSKVEAGKYYVSIVDMFGDGTTAGYMRVDYDTSTIVNSSTSNTLSKPIYVKFSPTTAVDVTIRYYNNALIGAIGYVQFDGARLYEIDSATYAKIDVDPEYTGDKLADKFPYVDSVKHVQGVAITKQGKNLLPPFTEWTLNANAVVTEPYKLTLNATAGSQSSAVKIPVLPNTAYTISATHNGRLFIDQYNSNAVYISSPVNTSAQSATFTTNVSTGYLMVFMDNSTSGTFTFTNPILVVGSSYDSVWEPQNIDYVYAVSTANNPTIKLASNVDGTVKDTLFYRDGAWRKEKRWVTDFVLDGSLAWIFNNDQTGYKSLRIDNFVAIGGVNTASQTLSVSKYNGAVLGKNYGSVSGADNAFIVNNQFFVNVSDIDTGFDNAYIPANSEFPPYFNGWKVNGYTAGTTVTNEASGSVAASGTYTLLQSGKYRNATITKSTDGTTFFSAVEGTDYTMNWNATKAVLTNPTAGALYYQITYTYGVTPNSWTSVVDASAPSTNTLAYVSANKAPNYTPYSLTYQLAKTVEEVVTVEGSINLHSGGNQIEVSEGVIVREKVTPKQGTGLNTNVAYYINMDVTKAVGADAVPTGQELKNKASTILKLFKNGIEDKKWTIGASTNAYGAVRASCLNADYDPAAEYTVTYTIYANDKSGYTANCTDVSIDYKDNLASTVSRTNADLSDAKTSITVLQKSMSDKINQGVKTTDSPTFANVPNKSTADITLYVDVVNGNDANDGLVAGAGRALKTIGAAIGRIPQIVNHNVTVNAANGTYNEDVTIKGIKTGNGVISLTGNTGNPDAVIVKSITVIACNTMIIAGFISSTTTSAPFYVKDSININFNSCKTTAALTVGTDLGVSVENSTVTINSCTLSNHYYGVFASVNSKVFCTGNSGAGNTFAYFTYKGGVLHYSGTVPTSVYGIGNSPDGGTINPWGDNTQSNRAGVIATHNAMISVPAGTNTIVPFAGFIRGQKSGWDGSTAYTVPEDGYYLIRCSMTLRDIPAGNIQMGMTCGIVDMGTSFVTTSSGFASVYGVASPYLTAGQVVKISINSTVACNTYADPQSRLEILRIG